ncbi:ribonuclease 3-like [Onthophagus taurus]|uniref:ribonuclease 3-like n=1 Tax=Onthophagus taurus TaxID=166361 RepID=UPI0039BE8707
MDKLKTMFFENIDACEDYCRRNDMKMIDNLMKSLRNLSPEQKLDSMVVAYITIYDRFRETLLVVSSLFDQVQKYEDKYGPLDLYNSIINTDLAEFKPQQSKDDLNKKPNEQNNLNAPNKKPRKRNIKTSYQKLKQRDEPKTKPKQLNLTPQDELNQTESKSNQKLSEAQENFVKVMQHLFDDSKANHEKLAKLLKLTKESANLPSDDLKNVTIEVLDMPELKVPTLGELINDLSKKPELAEVNVKVEPKSEPSTSKENAEKNVAETKKPKKKRNKKNKKTEPEQTQFVYPDNYNRNNHNNANNRNNEQGEEANNENVSGKKKPLTSKERYESRKRLFTPTTKFH